MTALSKTSPPSRGISYLNMAAAIVIVVAGMRAAEAILNPLLLAVFLSIISAPAYFGLLKRGVSNWLALLTVIGVLSTVVLVMMFVVMGSIGSFTANANHYQERLLEEQAKAESAVLSWIPEALRSPTEQSSEADGETRDEVVGDEAVESAAIAADPRETTEINAAPPADVIEEATIVRTDAAAEAPNTEVMSDSEQADVTDDTAGDEPAAVSGERITSASSPSLVFREPTTSIPPTPTGYLDRLKEQFSPASAISMAVSVARSIGQLLSNAFLILLIVIFILMEAGGFNRKLDASFERSEEATRRAQEIIGSVHHYIVIKTWVSLATALLVWIWLWWWGVSHAPLWGMLAFLMNYIPNVGSVLAAVPAVLVAWLDIGALPATAVAMGFAVINGGIGNFLEPRLMGKTLGLSPLVIFFSMLFWGWVLGPTGMLLSVPLTMAGRIAMDGFDDTRWIATLMGNTE